MAVLDMLELRQFHHSAFCLRVPMVLQAKGLSFPIVEVTLHQHQSGWGSVASISKHAVLAEHPNHLVKLLISPIRRQLDDAALNSGLADDGWLNHLIAQQRPWLHEIKNVGHGWLPRG